MKGRSRGKEAQQTVRRGPPRILGTAGREPHGATGTTGATTPRDSPAMVRAGPRKLGPAQPRETHSRWCGRGSWGDPGRGRVRICCKGAPGRDRHREKARNINDSPRTLRRDRGLRNRFGQSAPPGALSKDGRRLDGGRDEHASDPADCGAALPGHSGRPQRRRVLRTRKRSSNCRSQERSVRLDEEDEEGGRLHPAGPFLVRKDCTRKDVAYMGRPRILSRDSTGLQQRVPAGCTIQPRAIQYRTPDPDSTRPDHRTGNPSPALPRQSGSPNCRF